MKINQTKKIISGILFFFILFACAYPRETKAQWATIDAPNLATNVLNGVSQFASSAFDYSENFKEYILDPLVSGLAEMLLQEITRSIVTWINNGFEGSPSFVQNPGAFFLDVADQMTGQFIKGDLAELCSPFSIDIRIALSFKYRPNIGKRYACTLSTIIANSKNAIDNASINGFTAGDFKQGGWPAFVSLTTEPQNNVFGAYLTAESDLAVRVANKQEEQKNELSQGKGFLSWKKCVKYDGGADYAEGSPQAIEVANRQAAGLALKCLEYEVQTPGSVIANSLEKQLDIPVEKLGLADEIGEIVNALFAQLASQVLQKGLAQISKKDASGSSYLDSVVNDLENQRKAGDVGSQITTNIDKYLDLATRILSNRLSSFEVIGSTKAMYDSAEQCYVDKIANNQPPLDASETLAAQAKIATIHNSTAAGTGFYSVYTAVQAQRDTSQETYDTVLSIKAQTTSAQSLQEVNAAATAFKKISDPSNPDRLDERNVQKSLDDYNNLLTSTAPLRAEATTFMQQCQAFPPPKKNTSNNNN